MFDIQALFPQALPWLLLLITIVSAFTKPKLWPLGFIFSLLVGLFYNAIDIMGAVAIAILFVMIFYANISSHQIIINICKTLVIIFCIALAMHLVPGFNNLLVLNGVEKSQNSVAFTMYLNLDKPIILFALLSMQPAILKNKPKVVFIQMLNAFHLTIITIFTSLIIFSLAIYLSLIKFEPYLPSWWWLFAINNLLLTCVIEEVFFRGFIQQKLMTRYNPLVGLITASLLFGGAHFAGGGLYVLIATCSGILYGFVYQSTGKISYAILVHFCLNMVHLLLFTYPIAK